MKQRLGQFALAAAFLWNVTAVWSQESVNQNSLRIQDFERRIDGYMKLRKAAAGQLPRLIATEAPAAITQHERDLAKRIQEARPQAKQGDIFTPELSGEFRRLVGLATQGAGAKRIDKSLQHAEPVNVKVIVNEPYPPGIPLQSMPPSLILNFPMLPKELEYRIAAHDLILRDVEANLVVDFIAGAMP